MDQYKSLKHEVLMIKSGESSWGQSLGSFGDEGGDKFKASICGGNGRKTGLDGEWWVLPWGQESNPVQAIPETFGEEIKI